MSDKENIEQADLDPVADSDGKPDFTEGVTYEEALELATGAKYDSVQDLIAARKKLSFGEKLKLTWQGRTRVGRIAGTVLDIGELIAPTWAVRLRDSLQPKQTDGNMQDIFKRVFTKANGGFWRLWDQLEGRDWKYYIAFLLRAIIIFGIFYGADYLGLPVNEIIAALIGAG